MGPSHQGQILQGRWVVAKHARRGGPFLFRSAKGSLMAVPFPYSVRDKSWQVEAGKGMGRGFAAFPSMRIDPHHQPHQKVPGLTLSWDTHQEATFSHNGLWKGIGVSQDLQGCRGKWIPWYKAMWKKVSGCGGPGPAYMFFQRDDTAAPTMAPTPSPSPVPTLKPSTKAPKTLKKKNIFGCPFFSKGIH